MNRPGTALLMVVMAMSVLGLLCISFLLVGGYMRASSADSGNAEQEKALSRVGFDYAVLQAINSAERSDDPQDIQPITVSPWPTSDTTSSYAMVYSVQHRTPGMIVKVSLLKQHVLLTRIQGVCKPMVTAEGIKKWQISSSQIG